MAIDFANITAADYARFLLVLEGRRADEYAAVQRSIRQQTLGVANAAKRIAADNAVPAKPRQIVLELITGQAPNAPSTPPTPSILTLPTFSTLGGVTTAFTGITAPPPINPPSPIVPQSNPVVGLSDSITPGPNNVAFISFDISLAAADAFMQSVSTRHNARQSIHQTAKGYYVDEFNIAPGKLMLDSRIVFIDTPASQVQAFVDMLYKAKMTTPMSPDTPKTLIYHDVVSGRSFVITQNSVEITVSADEPNIGHATIDADILLDFNGPHVNSTTADNTTTPVGTGSNQVSLLSYQTASGSQVALASNTDIPTIGSA